MAWWAQVIQQVVQNIGTGAKLAGAHAASQQIPPSSQPIQREPVQAIQPGQVEALFDQVQPMYEDYINQSLYEDQTLRPNGVLQGGELQGFLADMANRRTI
jgi:hypothetical protein